jgi:hypothetical protein
MAAVQGRAVKRWGKSLASRQRGSKRTGRTGVGGVEEATVVTGASVMGSRRFSMGILASETCSMTSLN